MDVEWIDARGGVKFMVRCSSGDGSRVYEDAILVLSSESSERWGRDQDMDIVAVSHGSLFDLDVKWARIASLVCTYTAAVAGPEVVPGETEDVWLERMWWLWRCCAAMRRSAVYMNLYSGEENKHFVVCAGSC